MNARVSASVRFGSRLSARVVRSSTYVTRSAAVSPGTGLRSRDSACSNSRPSAETSRWIFEGKYR